MLINAASIAHHETGSHASLHAPSFKVRESAVVAISSSEKAEKVVTMTLVEAAQRFIAELFAEKLPSYFSFHNVQHTKDVVQQAIRIGEAYRLTEAEMEILVVAAWFHDAGYTEVYEGHEVASMELARVFLQEQNATNEQIHGVLACINATTMPQQPKTLMEKILCDADVSNIGLDSFFDMSARLRQEQQTVRGKSFTDAEWFGVKHGFCVTHRFHTDYAVQHYGQKQAENARILESEAQKAFSLASLPAEV
ncbi:MAG: HD domain-containing protein [Candidatus Kapaibacterium sp.]|nr:MAG: HD domain-containing protein [Candidatus Kapabacteria bacterium]